jgi:integrase
VFQWNGKRAEMGLGGVADVGVAEAREKRDAARKLVAKGVNPIDERWRLEAEAAEADKVKTFGAVLDEVIASKAGGWKNAKHKKQWKSSIENHAAVLLPMAVDQITTDDVEAVVKPIWDTIQETASRVRGRIETVLDYAIAKRWRKPPNPAAWKGNLQPLLSERRKLQRGHFKAMPYQDAPAFMAELALRKSMAARALELTILTWVRESMTLEATRREFDIEAATWTVPPERMKGGREFIVPLSPAALAIVAARLEFVEGPDDLVFPGQKKGRPLSNMAMDMLLRRMKRPYTVHGFRSTAKDWASDRTNFPDEVSEEALAHLVGSATRRAYRRGEALDKRRRLMEAWARYLTAAAASNVTRLRG